MQSREGMPLGKARCWASHEARCLAQRRMAVGPSHPQRMPQTAMTVISTKRCLRLRVCRGSESASKYELMEPPSTSLATGVILGSVGDGFRAPNQGVRQPEDNDRIKDSEPRSVAPDYPDRTAMRAGRGCREDRVPPFSPPPDWGDRNVTALTHPSARRSRMLRIVEGWTSPRGVACGPGSPGSSCSCPLSL